VTPPRVPTDMDAPGMPNLLQLASAGMVALVFAGLALALSRLHPLKRLAGIVLGHLGLVLLLAVRMGGTGADGGGTHPMLAPALVLVASMFAFAVAGIAVLMRTQEAYGSLDAYAIAHADSPQAFQPSGPRAARSDRP